MSSLQKLVKKFGLVQDKRCKHGLVYRFKDGMPDRAVLEKLGYKLICVDNISTVYKSFNDGSIVQSTMYKGDMALDHLANSSYMY
jgi:hypothetical protein